MFTLRDRDGADSARTTLRKLVGIAHGLRGMRHGVIIDSYFHSLLLKVFNPDIRQFSVAPKHLPITPYRGRGEEVGAFLNVIVHGLCYCFVAFYFGRFGQCEFSREVFGFLPRTCGEGFVMPLAISLIAISLISECPMYFCFILPNAYCF